MKLFVLLLLSVSTAFGQSASTGPFYDVSGHLTAYVYPDGKRESYSYDSSWRMTSFRDRNGKTSVFHYNSPSSSNTAAAKASPGNRRQQ